MDDADLVRLEVVGQRRHPSDGVGIALAELRRRDLLAVREHATHVLALVVAAERQRVGPLTEKIDDRARIGASIDQIADADDELAIVDASDVEQREQLGVAAMNVS